MAKINRRRKNLLNIEDVHGYRLSRHSVDQTFSEIVGTNLEGRKQIPGLSKGRADIIVGGLIPLVLLMRYLDSDHITFSNNGLREGILFEYLNDLRTQNTRETPNNDL